MDTKLASACAGWNAATAEAARDDPADRAAGLGRWWLARPGGCIVLSGVAAGLLGVGLEPAHGICWDQVVAEDRAGVQTALARIGEGHAGDAGFNGTGCEFRVRHEGLGVRWLRLDAVGASDDGRIVAGIVVDVTPARHAEARERFNFALTQYLVGSDNLDEAVVNILQLVCEELGWEWGAYWESTSESTADDGAAVLRCRNSWHVPGLALASFEQASLALRLAPEQGLIGEVWASGQARWIDDASSTVDLVRAHAARDCMLHSAFFFPVTFVGSDGRLLRPGVLEFFSNLQRQPDAQLPGLANAISAMIAQAVERMTQQERMRVHAQTDEMTGLANRRHFCDALERMCRNAAPGQSFGVLFVDLDHFKSINDAFGHEAGNRVLTGFAALLRQAAPAGWTVGRLGGDEFALLSGYCDGLADMQAAGTALLDAARRHFADREHGFAVSASIGVSIFPEHGTCPRELLHAADGAMYQSKRRGRNLVSYYDGDSKAEQASSASQLGFLAELHGAIGRDEFFLAYQPICDSRDGRVVAAEALIRWRRPNGEIVSPAVFIPIAEKSRLIHDIGRWVLGQVCRDLARLGPDADPDFRVHLNMAAPEFIDSDLPATMLATAQAHGIAPRQICLELTEGVVMRHAETAIPVMHALRRLGFDLGLDDFGMGYSSLSLLKNLPLGAIKIDRQFIAGVPDDRADCAIVRAILDLGRRLELQIIVEGVENEAQLAFLRGCDSPLVQGYLLGRPMPFEAVAALA